MQLPEWHKGIVHWTDDDTAYISVVFSWDAQQAYSMAIFYRELGFKVKVGGPGVFVLHKMFDGIADVGGSIPDVVTRHNPMATFASRGCDVGCWFCIVPPMEGRTFTLYEDFTPRPILCDNNLSALPAEFQNHIILRYKATGVPLLDANSGFEPRTFSPDVYHRWKAINKGPWRFAFDEVEEREDVARVMAMLREVPASLKRVYVLIGNEPFESCMERIEEVIAWGGEPHVQPVKKLNAEVNEPWVKFDWTSQRLKDVARWSNQWLWRKIPFVEYDRAMRKAEAQCADARLI